MIGNDLTKGNVTKTLLRFTVPFMVANILHTLYSIVDMFIVGRFADAAQLSAVSTSSVIMLTVNLLLTGFGTGGTVIVGQKVGMNDEESLRKNISTIFSVLPLLAVVTAILCLIFRHTLLRLVNTPAECYAGAEAYLRICLYGLVFTGMFCAISAVLRGQGDSKGPTIFIAISCCCNIVGDTLCVGLLGMGAAGAALATTVSQGISVVLGYFYLRKHHFPFDFRPRSFRIHKTELRILLRVAIPTALQEVMSSITFVFLEAIINERGYIASAAAGVADRIFTVSFVPSLAFAAAIAAMVAQNSGAGLQKRARKCMVIGTAFSFGIALLIFAVMALNPEVLFGIFSDDAEVVRMGVEYMFFYKFDALLCALIFCLNGYINGIGHTRYTLVNNLVSSFAVRLPAVWIISRMAGTTLYHIGIGLPLASLVQVLICIAFFLFSKSERALRSRPVTEGDT